ncbi:MAG: glycosyltransferase family 2 protein [Fibromonadales bacterium]|nr:glycosyltransferase family 2 protein [Fibromonadales bacterium]
MPTPLISIAIPAYNAEKYIEECLNSILSQTFQNWECIIVNDGSTDNTLGIIESFTTKDNRFSCYSIPNSGSAKIPRDIAISHAKANWIMEIDADDYVNDDVLEKLYARAMETGVDIVYLRMRIFNEQKSQYFLPGKDFDMQKILTGKEAVMLTMPKWQTGAIGIVKRELWNSRSTLNTGIKHMNIDEYDTREMLIKANAVAFEDVIYNYRQHTASITKKFSIKLFETIITDKMLEDLFSEHFGKGSPQKIIASKYRIKELFSKRTMLFRIGSKLQIEERKKARDMIKEYYPYNYALLVFASFCRYILRSVFTIFPVCR